MKLYLDEDTSHHSILAALRSRGIDVVSSLEAGMNGREDEDHLVLAAAQDRVIVTGNVGDFALLHTEWASAGRPHSGIIIATQQRYSTGEFVRRILRVVSSRVAVRNGLFFLSNF